MSVATETILDEAGLLGKQAHYVCCKDDDLALCGEDLSDAEWTTATITCADCVVNDHRGHCPLIKNPCVWGKDRYSEDA